MATIIKASDQAEVQAKRADRQRQKQRVDGISGKAFEILTPPEKDTLLKAIGVRLGLISDSDD